MLTDHGTLLSILKERRCDKSFNSRLTRWVDRLFLFHFKMERMPGAQLGLVDYISRHPNQKTKKVSVYDENISVAKLNRISASSYSLNLKSNQSAPHLHNLITVHDPAPQITIYSEPAIKSINTINTFDTRLLLEFRSNYSLKLSEN